LAALGFAVAIVDGRGSARRGLQFEGYLKHKFGQMEVQDQACLVNYLVNERKISHPDRICITGWSYGGYLSLLSLAQRPDIFKLAVAGAPVTIWQAYDTGYTEVVILHYYPSALVFYRSNSVEMATKTLALYGYSNQQSTRI